MSRRQELVYFPSRATDRQGYAERVRAIFEESLRRKGLLMTDQRRAILDLLLNANRHLSEEDIYKKVRPQRIGKVTVFRTLKVLENSGLIESVTPPGEKPRFEIKTDRPHHDHLICIECRRIIEVRWSEIERIQNAACRKLGFEVRFHRHEVFGRCRACRGEE